MSLPLVFYSKSIVDTDAVCISKNGYRQSKPYNLVSPYRFTAATARNTSAKNVNAEQYAQDLSPKMVQMVKNKLNSKFNDAIGEKSSFGATLTAELKETLGMVTGTTLRLYQAARRIKKMDFGGAASILGLPYKERTITKVHYRRSDGKHAPRKQIITRRRVFSLPTGREVSKTLANGWLLYSYGAKPLAGDMYNGLDVLQRPLREQKKVTVACRDEYVYTNYYAPLKVYDKRAVKVRGLSGAYVTVSNPNAYLLDQMGLTNPALWVLEAIPFSFVIDWFSNLSQVVGALVPPQGVTIEAPYTCMQYKSDFQTISATSSWESSGFVLTRSSGIPDAKLVFAYERIGLERALNAISLLIGIGFK